MPRSISPPDRERKRSDRSRSRDRKDRKDDSKRSKRERSLSPSQRHAKSAGGQESLTSSRSSKSHRSEKHKDSTSEKKDRKERRRSRSPGHHRHRSEGSKADDQGKAASASLIAPAVKPDPASQSEKVKSEHGASLPLPPPPPIKTEPSHSSGITRASSDSLPSPKAGSPRAGTPKAGTPPASKLRPDLSKFDEEVAAADEQAQQAKALAASRLAIVAKPVRVEPLSLEELLKKKKLQQEEEAKPKFISKKDREAAALARLTSGRQDIVTSQSAMLSALRQQQGGLSESMPLPPSRGGNVEPSRDSRVISARNDMREYDRGNDRNSRGDRDREPERDRDGRGGGGGRDPRDRDRDVRDREPRDRDRDDRGRSGAGGAAGGKSGWAAEREREKELEMIKQQYLGKDKEKKKIMKASEKFRFNFDWDAKEDTSRDLNPLYNQTHEAALLFGRGMRAGIDRREQKKTAAVLEKDVMRRARAAAGIEESHETRQVERARAKLADAYDGYDMKVDKHWTEKDLSQMTDRDWRIFREDFNIAYKGSNNVSPIRSWDEAGLPDMLLKAIVAVGYKKPSPIQMAAIPLGLKFRDVIGVAETGSGKTAAFVIPMLTYIMKQPPMTEENEPDGPYSVVLAPTRELAQQIEEETIKLAQFTSFRVTSIVGGQSIEEQGTKLRRGCEIVIATPGRLIDCIERHYAVLNQCNYVVLDEADRMIDLGFEPQVMGVLDAMPSSNLKPEGEDDVLVADRVYRTTYMFSATMPAAVERLARKYLRRPVVVNIGSAGKATELVTQRVVMCKENEKSSKLEYEVTQVGDQKVIVFVNTKRQCDNVHSHLENLGHRCTVLHGSKSQDQREAGIKGFRDATFNVLIATDVAGRGIDVPDVALVVNYDMPNTIEAYTHRIGRTGRAGKKGTSLTLLTMSDTEVFFDLRKFLEESKMIVPPELARHEAAKVKPGGVDARPKRDIVFSNK